MSRQTIRIPPVMTCVLGWIALALLGAGAAFAQGADTRYVNINAPAGGNGLSWAGAYNNIKTAITAAVVNPAVKKIWVAKGSYFPGTTRFVVRNGLSLYGGFAGNETQLSQRNIALNETILTGNGTRGILDCSATNATTVIDGFTIRNGYSTGPGAGVLQGGPIFSSCRFINNISDGSGGAYYGSNASPKFLNCVFLANQGAVDGSAIGLYTSNLVVDQCEFRSNVGAGQGGAIFVDNGSVTVTRSSFIENGSGYGGSAITTRSAELKAVKCDFIDNGAVASAVGGCIVTTGGAISMTNCRLVGSGMSSGALSTYNGPMAIVNSLIAANAGTGISTYQGPVLLQNSTVAGNGTTNLISSDSGPGFTIRNSIVWSGAISGPVTAAYSCLPFLASGAGNIRADPMFMNPAGRDWRVRLHSPAIDAGSNALIPADTFDVDGDGNTAEPLPIDVVGFNRRVDEASEPDTGAGPAPVVDMGAHEYYPDCNGNFTLDSIDIASGASHDLDVNGIPDECEDCNANGLPDSLDIAKGLSADCDHNGTPDDCQFNSTTTVSYVVDDGTAEANASNLSIGNMIWLNAFQVAPGGGILRSVSVAFGSGMPAGAPATVHVWTDPNDDGNPADAVRRISVPVQAVAPGSGQFTTVDIPDIAIGSVGTWFYVGMQTTDLPFPAPLDRDVTGQRSWIAAASGLAGADPDHLGAAGRFGLIDSFNLSGNWLIRAVATRSDDSNDNGVLDACEIAAGTTPDCNGNLVPDAAEPPVNDCNGNGVPDSCEIASGAASDCQPNGIPDSCEIAAGLESDIDANGVPDSCEDCNRNGIPDGLDIKGGLSADCQPDGIPDECQLPSELLDVYAYDDGRAEYFFGPGGPPSAVWLSNFKIEEGKERIVAIDIMFGFVPYGTPHTIYLWSDPNGDGNPSDARVLAQVDTVALVIGSAQTYTRVNIPDVVVGPPGTSFFIGAGATNLLTSNYPAAKSSGAPIFKSWFISRFGAIDPNNLSQGAAEFTRMDDLGGLFIGSWCLRALAESIADCNANNRPDDCDIAEGFSLDVNHNGKPDECEPCLFDLDGDGAIGGGDLAILLGSWGNSPGPADVNGDGSVDGKDLSLVLSAWGGCS